ncbi:MULTISPECIES: hypothetical protein [unclassified Bradyrhizobium]|uniref:hypothetical protein n=1 Tax=unclassified Bradyrhizobium TaxID=2631580 RepID=UPI002479A517|nr:MULTISPECIES: hypothetical protein [unclassified Bradyrhizobium]WGR67836.1 hypothetical protein MTX24_20420 [Bradyrhizobium sp. ISRA426]WGR79889.1 hypothetical protein MTX21_05535 [Bradyrhizobium sp. ISRA430]WGR83075.1 hypothetical protein MTX25_20100 [Bradyrhizobium sp. ISRA432]
MIAMLSEEQLRQLINDLRDQTALGRIALREAEEIFARLVELGYVVSKPANG